MPRPVNPRYRRPKERVYRKGFCCWCGKPLPPPPSRRRDWCSDRCVQEYKSFEPAALREDCYARDGGFCRICHRDVAEIERRLKLRTRAWCVGWTDRNGREATIQDVERARRWRRFLRRLKLEASHLWEADHKIPVVEGGLNCLANLRTLCVPCHKRETRKLAARRAALRAKERATEAAHAQPSLPLETRVEG